MINAVLRAEDYSGISDGVYDEVFTASGEIRDCYEPLLRHMQKLGTQELQHRRARIRNVLHDNDLVSSLPAHTAADGIDALPHLITAGEWTTLEAGLQQRIRLFNALAADIYGKQSLWRSGVLPPALLHRNPNFLKPSWGYQPPLDTWVHMLATRIQRGSDGRFYALSDQTQIPVGLGRTLENRLAISRAFPDLFRSIHAMRLAMFFKTLQDSLGGLSSVVGREKNIALLASAPDGATRAESAILSRYMGFQLVENDDLSIRDEKVYLKTLTGLKPVDVLLRLVDDSLCDPLELRIDSGEGCSGLMMAMRQGHIAVANAIGSGVLQAPLMRTFLPQICAHLLGEELLLPSPQCRWLGEEQALQSVTDSPDGLILRKAFGAGRIHVYDTMTAVGQMSLLEEITGQPDEWIAETTLQGATTPVWSADQWQVATVSVDCYSLLDQTGAPVVMPGGLGCYEILRDGQQFTGNKDVWVLSDQPVSYFSLLAPAGQPVTLSRAGGDLPSRAADGLFLLGRHIEAADAIARLGRVISLRLSDQTLAESPEVPLLLQVGAGQFEPVLQSDPETSLWTLIGKQDHPGGLQEILKDIRLLAVQLRDRLSDDTWKLLHNFGEEGCPDKIDSGSILPYLNGIVTGCLAFAGLAAESMTRGHGWRFQEMGRRVEHAIRSLRLFNTTLLQTQPMELAEQQLLQALLEVGNSSMTYHRRYGGRLQTHAVADLFLCDETNPRSVVFQILRLQEEAKLLPQSSADNGVISPFHRELLRLSTDLRLADVTSLVQDTAGYRQMLDNELTRWIAAIERIAELLSRNYLSHAPRRRTASVMATEV